MITAIDLSGTWKFSFGQPAYDDTITLPNTTATARAIFARAIFARTKAACTEPDDGERQTGYLTERYPYEGRAYFAREVVLPEGCLHRTVFLFLERTRLTKVSVDGVTVGEGDSLTAPHRFDLTAYIHRERFLLEIEVSNCGYPTAGGHMTSPDTQTNWLGILGRIELQIMGDASVRAVSVSSSVPERRLLLCCELWNDTAEEMSCLLTVRPRKLWLAGLTGEEGKRYDARPWELPLEEESLSPQTVTLRLKPGGQSVRLSYELSEEAPLWSEHTPVVCGIRVELKREGAQETDSFDTYGAVRSFAADKHDFRINGSVTKLRGKHDGLLFPLTGAAPMELKSWLTCMGTVWRYGINHYRYHTCCPPEAAFLAADLLGIYMEPELPFWGTVAAPGEEGYQEKEQDYLMEEGLRMLSEYGNHPSFCMLSLGNELWGSKERVNELTGRLKAADDRVLYTQGSNNFQFIPEILPNEDFYVGARLAQAEGGENKRLIRGSYAVCDKPLGVIQTMAPGTGYCFDQAVLPGEDTPQEERGGDDMPQKEPGGDGSPQAGDTIAIQYGTGVAKVRASETGGQIYPTVPVVSHEIGQYSMYPDYTEIPRYTGVLEAANLAVFRDRLTQAGMAQQAREFFLNSGRFAVACYREELEMMHRSRYIAGYQLLDLQDYTGQGTSLVGILNALLESKGLISEEEWRRFCSDEVLLASFDKYIYEEGEMFEAKVLLSYFNPLRQLGNGKLCWQLTCGERLLLQGDFPTEPVVMGTQTLGSIRFPMPDAKATDGCQKLTLTLKLQGTGICNQYVLWRYPARTDRETEELLQNGGSGRLRVTDDANRAWNRLKSGDDVLFFPGYLRDKLPGFYCTDFWNYTMFRQISEQMGRETAVGTLGLCIRQEHPALSLFDCETYSTPQWYHIVTGSDCAILDTCGGEGFRPIVQMIDNVERNHRLGILFEMRTAEGGKLLVCTADQRKLSQTPEGRQLLTSIVRYALSEDFAPVDRITYEKFMELFTEPAGEAVSPGELRS